MICPCGKILDIDEPAHGKPAQCPSCGNVFVAGKPIRSTTAIQGGAPEVKAGSPNSAAELNADNRSIEKSWKFPRGGYWILILLFATCVGICGLGWLWPALRKGIDIDTTARIQIGGLTSACKAYFDKNQRWPDQLKTLTVKDDNGIVYLESKDVLADPWSREYQYDVKGPKNNGVRPDIWTVAPDGEIIGNWPKAK